MRKDVFNKETMARIVDSGIIAVLEIEDEKNAISTAQALVRGGVTAIELTLRTKAAIPSIKLIRDAIPEMTIGIGTVIFPEQINQIVSAGAHFGVSPGLNPRILQRAKEAELSFAPGILTPSELENALAYGCKHLKFFPAEPAGGVQYLKSLNGPYNYLELSYIPLGGVSESNLHEYAAFPNVTAIGGSWIAKRESINNQCWIEIEERAAKAKKIWDLKREELCLKQ